jgi:alpha-glucosidase
MEKLLWWQTGVIYQVYPRSFQDTNGDGIGDLRGINQRLPYFLELGVDAIWISPIFPSPMADFGYDIANYTDIDPTFGSLTDFDDLVASAHASGLKIILDLVPNHTSDQHPWFQESRTSRDNPKRDWYIWREPKQDGGPPNNWLSCFGGSAWQYDKHTQQYFYHAFLTEQPDLNWRNPEVRAAMSDVMRFWLRRGVDGFRVDVVWHVIKDELCRDNPPNPHFHAGEPPHHSLRPLYTADLPEVHDVIAEMRRVTNEFPDRVLIGEIYLPIERLVAYYGRDLQGVHLPFNFSLIKAPWHARTIAGLIEEYEAALPEGGWPNWVLGNHDNPRVASRIGLAQAPVAAMLLLTLRGTPTIYYGDEIGMEQFAITSTQVRDPFEHNVPGQGFGRDGCRTPMQWDATRNAGFSTNTPWLPIPKSYLKTNIETQRRDDTSLYQLYRRLIALRRTRPALARGHYRPLAVEGDLLTYIREFENDRLLMALNLSDQPLFLEIPELKSRGKLLISSRLDREGETIEGCIDLRPNEGIVVQMIH